MLLKNFGSEFIPRWSSFKFDTLCQGAELPFIIQKQIENLS